MKLVYVKFIIFFAINLSSIYCEQKNYLIGSRFASDKQYKAYLLNHGGNADVAVAFGPKIGVKNPLKNQGQDSVEEFGFEVPQNVSNLNLKVASTIQNDCKEQSVDILNTAKSPVVFLHLDKPIYKTNDNFTYRVFIMSRDLLPTSDFGPIHVAILDSSDKVVEEFESAANTDEFGAYEETIPISQLPNLQSSKFGVWSIEVTANDRKVVKTFEVEDHVNNAPEVFVEAPSIVAFVDRKIYLNIHIKSPSGLTAYIKMTAKFVNSARVEITKNVKTIRLTDSKTIVMLDFQDDLGIKYPAMDMDLVFAIQVTGSNPTSVTKNIRMKHKGRNTIQVLRKKYFKPGFKLPIKVRVKVLDGRVDNSFNQLTSSIKYVSKHKDRHTNEPKVEEKVVQTNLNNGETVYQLQPKNDTQKIILSFEFAGLVHSEEIERFPGADEYMQVSLLNRSTTVGSTVQFKVQSTEEMELPHLLIFGTKGILHSQQLDDAIEKDVFDFPLILTEEMRPEVRGLVFYMRAKDGAIIYDEFSVNIGLTIENSLEIFAPEQAKPNEDVDITVKTEAGSKVYLIASDVNSALFNHENEISRTEIYNELVYHLNKKYEETADYHFEKLNAFILDPHRNGTTCEELSSRFGPTDDDDSGRQPPEIDRTPHKYFPEALKEVTHLATSSGNETVQMQFPDSTTTWKIYGISVHPTKGFTVSKTQPEIAVKIVEKIEKLKIEIKGPSAINQGDIHNVHIIATSEMKTQLSASVSVKVDGKYLIKDLKYGNLNCQKNQKSSTEDFDIQFSPENSVITKTLQVYSNGINPINIEATISGQKTSKKATETIQVNKKQITTKLIKTSLNTELIDASRIDLYPKYTNEIVIIYGNILGPAVGGLEKILSRTMILDEEKILKFGTEVVVYQFLKNTGLLTKNEAGISANNIVKYYHECKEILEKIIYGNDNDNMGTKIWLAALITDIMLDIPSDIEVNKHLIKNSLAFIKNQYIRNHNKFPYDVNSDVQRDISANYRETIQTALIAKVMLRSEEQEIRNPFLNVYDNLFVSLTKTDGDHVKAIAAYTLASHGQTPKAKNVLNLVNHGYKGMKFPHHFTMYTEVISYVILTKILLKEDPREQVNYLLKHRHANGGFYSPYDTYLALKALSEYSKFKNIRSRDFEYQINNNKNKYKLNRLGSASINGNRNVQTLMPVYLDLGYINVYREENDKLLARNTSFNMKEIIVSNIDDKTLNISMEFSYVYKQGKQSNLVALEVDIPEGFEVQGDGNTVDTIIQSGQKLIFYISKVENGMENMKSFILKEKQNAVKSSKPLYIAIYDYYRPNLKEVYTYDYLCV